MAKPQHTNKTNAMRQLESAGIEYGIAEYEVDESDLSGEHAAAEVGCSNDEMFKTLVTRAEDKSLHVFVIPTGTNLDLKKAAKAAGHKNLEMIHVKELVDLTGYMRGGCSPIGMKKLYPSFIDETAILYDKIYVSGGKRGLSLIVNPEELAELVNAKFADITK